MTDQRVPANPFLQSNGYTMVEILLVLSIFAVCTSIVTFFAFPYQGPLREDHFFKQLQKDLQLAKIYAMSHYKSVRIIFNPEEDKYFIVTGIDHILVQRKYEEEIEMINTTFKQFYYLPNGNVSNFGSFYIVIGGKVYKVVLHVGRGRVSIEKM